MELPRGMASLWVFAATWELNPSGFLPLSGSMCFLSSIITIRAQWRLWLGHATAEKLQQRKEHRHTCLSPTQPDLAGVDSSLNNFWVFFLSNSQGLPKVAVVLWLNNGRSDSMCFSHQVIAVQRGYYKYTGTSLLGRVHVLSKEHLLTKELPLLDNRWPAGLVVNSGSILWLFLSVW